MSTVLRDLIDQNAIVDNRWRYPPTCSAYFRLSVTMNTTLYSYWSKLRLTTANLQCAYSGLNGVYIYMSIE